MIRKGTIEDAEILSKVEATCFPPNEAATSKEIQERLNVYANHFLLLFEKNQLISFIDGFCTNQRDLTARQENRKGLVLTCKDRLVPYYSKFGFKNEGVSSSVHGGVVWYQMRLEF